MEYVHIPEADEQTDIRRASLFWLTQLECSELESPDNQPPQWATWLLRSKHNPYNPYWRGVEIEAGTDVSPGTELFRAVGRVAGISPWFIDLVAVLQPDDHPDIHHTTFVYTACGKAPGDPNPRLLPKPIVGLSMGVFPINELPLDEMRPAEAALIPDILQQAVEDGLSTSRVEYVPGNYFSSGVLIR